MTFLSVVLWLLLAGQPPSPDVLATVWIRAGDRGVGTGWVVDAERRWVVTARHVVGDRESVDVFFLDRFLRHSNTDRQHYVADRADLQKRGLIATGRVLARRDQADLVLLVLDRMPAGTPSLPLATNSPRIGDACHSIGHRHDAELMWNRTDGHVRQVGRLPEGYFWAGKRIGAGVPVLFLQSPIEAGESGSAVLNAGGEVIGMVSAMIQPLPEMANAIAGSEVRELLADARKEPVPPPLPLETKARVDAEALSRATVWVLPQATGGRAAGAFIDGGRPFVLTSATAVGSELVVDVVFPRRYLGRVVAEVEEYRDLLGLRLSGHAIPGVVLARDPVRDLALIELDSMPEVSGFFHIAATDPRMGDSVAAMGHPTGVDALWLYAAGSVRSVGRVVLSRDATDEQPKAMTALLQLPHQGSASGGPVVNEAGELVGILAARESTRQDLAYAATPSEIRAFFELHSPLGLPIKSSDHEARGRLFMKAGRLAKARDTFQSGLAEHPRDQGLMEGLATVLCRLGEKAEARKIVEDALRQNRRPTGLAELADVVRVLGEPVWAEEIVAGALKVDARCAAALVVRARLRSGKAAADDIAEAQFINPNLATAFAARASLRDRTTTDGRREAIADWSRYLELSPVDLDALRERAVLFEAIREPKKAVADWSRLTELEPLRMENWVGLAKARFAAGDRNGAADALVAAARVKPENAVAVFRIVRDLAEQLAADNPANVQRVRDWYSVAVTKLAAWLPD
jgi:S1-C subfamily serine protease/tetratricopeptide (TPR) repeat protein